MTTAAPTAIPTTSLPQTAATSAGTPAAAPFQAGQVLLPARLRPPAATGTPPQALDYMEFMAVDYGKKRIGVAVGNRLLGTATPCKSVVASGDARFTALAAHIAQWQPQALVLGIPYHPDGAAHANTRRAAAFGQQLANRFQLPVFTVDERYSTTEAHASGARDADAAAACIILEQFFSQSSRTSHHDNAPYTPKPL